MYLVGVCLECMQRLRSAHFPKTHNSIGIATSQHLAIDREGQCMNACGICLKYLLQPPALHIPELHHAISAATRNLLCIWAEYHRPGRLAMPRQGMQQLPMRDIP